MPTYTQTLQDLALLSTWEVSGSTIKNQTLGVGTRSVTVTVPNDETLEDVVLVVTTTQSAGGTLILSAGGVSLYPGTAAQRISLRELITGSGTFDIVFRYKDRGNTAWSSGMCTMHFNDMSLEVITEAEDVPVEPDDPLVDAAPENAIVLYDAFEESYTAGLGLAVLTPTECTVSEEAGGQYMLKLTHPLTEDERWKGIEPMSIISAPVPVVDTPVIDAEDNAIVEEEFEIYGVKTGGASFYNTRSTTCYPAWVAGTAYLYGAKVRRSGRNYVCRMPNSSSIWISSYWTDKGTGAPTVTRTIPEDTEVTVSDISGGWAHVKLPDGAIGYVKSDRLEWLREDTTYSQDPEEIAAHRISLQAFRVTEVKIDSNRGVLQATAQHISYDASMVVLDHTAAADDVVLPEAVQAIRRACVPDGESTAPHIYAQFPNAHISGDWHGRSLAEAVLDPDTGLVIQAKARLVRDNRDFFLLEDAAPDRGLRLRWGANLNGVQWNRDFSKVITRVVPVAKAADGSPLYCSPPCVDSPLLRSYPMPMAESLTVSGQVGKAKSSDDSTAWTVDTLREHMQEEAQKRFDEDHADEPSVTLSVTFILLGDTEEFAQYKPLERLCLYDTVSVWDPTIGLDVSLQVKSYEWDAIHRRYTRITLGDVFAHDRQTVAGYTLQDGSITARKLDAAALSLLNA